MRPPKKPVPLVKLARRLGVHVSTVHRWRQNGVGGVKLSCVKIGGRWFAAREAVSAFLAELNGGRDVSAAADSDGVGKAAERRRTAEAAALEQRLIARGL